MKYRVKELDLLASGLAKFQGALAELCAKIESSHAMVTMLAHGDLSRRSIFVDDGSTPIAVLD